MNRFFQVLAAVLVVLTLVGVGTFAGCVAGFFGGSASMGGSLNGQVGTIVAVCMGIGAVAGLIGGLFIANKILHPPPPRQ